MLFLKDTIEHRKLQGNISPSKNPAPRTAEAYQDEICLSDTSNNSYTDNEPAPLQHSDHGSQVQTHSSQPSTERGNMDPPLTPNITKKRKQRPDMDDPYLAIEKEKLKLYAGNAAAKEDSDHQFLMSLVPFLKNVPFPPKTYS